MLEEDKRLEQELEEKLAADKLEAEQIAASNIIVGDNTFQEGRIDQELVF